MSIDTITLWRRHKFMKLLRNLFDAQDFIEIETPYLLKANTPDPHVDPIFCQCKYPIKQSLQLHTSPEIWLKKALALGFPKIYEIARVFRDDPVSFAHGKEFTMIEWYRKNADLNDLLADCLKIFDLAHQSAENPHIPCFQEKSLNDLFLEHVDIDLQNVLEKIEDGNYLELNNILKARGELFPKTSTFVDVFFIVMVKYIEPKLPKDKAIVMTRWPAQLAALAAPCVDNPLFCDRFEIYYEGLEIANAYQECLDPKILRTRFERENTERKTLKKPMFSIDEDFLTALIDQPKTAGIALGLDRLLMAAMKKKHLSELIWGWENP